MKIRIGNDIKLYVTLLSSKVIDSVNIKSIEAFVINATKEHEQTEDLKNKTRFISRFPVEPYVDAFCSTAYDIKSSGYPTWRAYPQNYIYGSYAGFGYKPYWPDHFKPAPMHNLTEFKAPIKATKQRDTVEVFFPAEAQLYTGTYNLVIVAKIYEPGYSNNDLRTVTMDYENIFTLVNKTEDGVDSDVTLSVASSHGSETATSVVVSGSTYCMVGGNDQLVARVYPVDIVDPSVKWYVDPKDVTYVVLTNQTPTTCRFHAIQLPEGEDSHVVTIWAESVHTPGITGKAEITIARSDFGDVYTFEGEQDDNALTLNLTSGQNVSIDTSKYTQWHEGE